MIYLFSSLQVAHLGSVGFDYIANAPLLMVSSVSLDIKYLFFLVDSSLFFVGGGGGGPSLIAQLGKNVPAMQETSV